MLTFHHDITSGLQYLLPLESDELLCISTLTVEFQLTIFKISIQTNHMAFLQNVKQSGHNLVIGMMLPTSGPFWYITGPYNFGKTQKSELVKYLKTTFSPHVRWLQAHNLRYQKQDRFWIGWFRILTAQVDSWTCQLRKMISQTFGLVGNSSAE